jgi:hypothetical protein
MTKFLVFFLLTFAGAAFAQNAGRPPQVVVLVDAASSTGAKPSIEMAIGAKTFQTHMNVTSGSGTAAVTIEASLDGGWWDSIGTMAATNSASDSITGLDPRYRYYRANVTGLTGTGATVTVTSGN